MTQLRLALVCVLGVLLVLPQAASGGGWWSHIDLNRTHLAPGQGVELKEQVGFESVAAAEAAAQGTDRFYVYLLRGFDYAVVERAMRRASPGDWWSLGGAEAVEAGPVRVTVTDGNLGWARAAFTVPELPAGTYHLMLCDTACAEPLADVIPARGFTVVADPAAARMGSRIDRLERRTRNQAARLSAARADTDRALAAARTARAEVEQLKRSLASPADERRDAPSAGPWAYAGWLVAGAFAGALALLGLRRRRSRPPRPARDVGWHPTDEELRELLSSESRDPR